MEKTPEKLIIKESEVDTLIISDMATTNKKTHLQFEINASYANEERPRIAAIWVNKTQAKKIISKLNRFIIDEKY